MNQQAIDALTIVEIKAEITRLYEEVDLRTNDFVETHGVGRFDFDLQKCIVEIAEADEKATVTRDAYFARMQALKLLEKGPYLKFEAIDNVAALQAGEAVYRSAAVKAITVLTRTLKNCPPSLKVPK